MSREVTIDLDELDAERKRRAADQEAQRASAFDARCNELAAEIERLHGEGWRRPLGGITYTDRSWDWQILPRLTFKPGTIHDPVEAIGMVPLVSVYGRKRRRFLLLVWLLERMTGCEVQLIKRPS